jgi:hypothetical protein
MYGVIQGDGTTYTWKVSMKTFKSLGSGSRPITLFCYKINLQFCAKTLAADLNNDFIDSYHYSIVLIYCLNKIVDIMFGPFSVSVIKTVAVDDGCLKIK